MPIAPIASEEIDQVGRGYPRPQLVRALWYSLNGQWDFALDPEGRWRIPQDVLWDDHLEVPFAPEAPSSGVAQTGFFLACWYRRHIELPIGDPSDLSLTTYKRRNLDRVSTERVAGHSREVSLTDCES